jgi:hypothetical protein
MIEYNCKCGKIFKHKIPVRHHLVNSHKGEILQAEEQMMKNSFICVYCDKNITGSRKTHLRSHLTKIISLVFQDYIIKN